MKNKMENKEINNGFIWPVIEDEHFILGSAQALPQNILRINGDWTDSLPKFESQLLQFDVFNCTGFGTLSALEILTKASNDNQNFSDRYLGIVAGTKPPGNDPHVVAEAIRHYGAVVEEILPFSQDLININEYFSYKGANESYIRSQGQRWLNKYFYGHEWVVTDKTAKDKKLALLKQALTFSPICISVTAWFQNDKGLYYSPAGLRNGHWTVCYKIDDTGIYVFDSYEGNNPGAEQKYLKKLTLDHDISFAKRFSITLRDEEMKQADVISFWQQIRDLWARVFDLKKKIDSLPPLKDKYPNGNLMPSKLDKFCQAIKQHEGFFKGSRSERNNNPGNVKFYKGGYLAKYGIVKADKQDFAIFHSYEIGYDYLKNLIRSKCAKNPTWTFYQFFENYAPNADNNDSRHYAETVAKACGVKATDIVKNVIIG